MRSRSTTPEADLALREPDPGPGPSLRTRPAPPARHTVAARVLLAAMTWFIVYGSLFPFDFADAPRPLSSFLGEADLFANRADAIDNLVLFVPFGIALQASFTQARARLLGAALGLLVLGVGIQLVQLYLPSRTASLSDVAWNAAGMAAGMLLAARIRAWLAGQMAGQEGEHDNFLLLLVAVWVCYESFPFLPTLDVGLLRAHARPAVFAPPFDLARLLQHGAAACLAGFAVMGVGWLRRPVRGLVLLGTLAVVLEVAVPYGALRRETLLGIVLGLGAGWLLAGLGARRAAALVLPLALAMLVYTVLTPYRGQWRGEEFTLIPFSRFLWHSALGVLPPTAFEALAVGALLWSGLRLGRGPALGCCLLVVIGVGMLEVLRVALAGYQGDTTVLALALLLAPCAAAMRPHPWRGPRRPRLTPAT